ncbi:hypothetical protein Tco_0625681 [Tanacetum coccineum]|uniref:Uncharacterized protein n=1 Tax=Tanacetum coccineum TaxID=301880 RepID=A0ABQ4WHM4_9ASTR
MRWDQIDCEILPLALRGNPTDHLGIYFWGNLGAMRMSSSFFSISLVYLQGDPRSFPASRLELQELAIIGLEEIIFPLIPSGNPRMYFPIFLFQWGINSGHIRTSFFHGSVVVKPRYHLLSESESERLSIFSISVAGQARPSNVHIANFTLSSSAHLQISNTCSIFSNQRFRSDTPSVPLERVRLAFINCLIRTSCYLCTTVPPVFVDSRSQLLFESA